VVLDGTNAGLTTEGLTVSGPGTNVTIRGLVIQNFTSNGININGTTSQAVIGGTGPGEGNVIIGNKGIGLSMSVNGNVVEGNFIGTDATGLANLGNGREGVFINDVSSNNVIGGTVAGAGNVIAFNVANGIGVDSGTGNAIWGNSIFSNQLLGIDLGFNGVTPNDLGDPDMGANNFQNFPVLTSVTSANGSTTIQGTLNSNAGANFRVEFFVNDACDPSGNGEGQTLLGAVDPVTTDGSGNATINMSFPVSLSATKFITATATNNVTKDTSEFSACLQATVLVENCTNGKDDDGDGLIDCADPDCAADPACLTTKVGGTAEICNNGIDDDGDGLVDCADPDCFSSPLCTTTTGSGCSLGVSPGTLGLAGFLLPFAAVFGIWIRRKVS
jgi:hypothetical protein